MIIDFHAHTFPDSIAAKTIEKLETVGHIKAFSARWVPQLRWCVEDAFDKFSPLCLCVLLLFRNVS